MGCAQSKIDNEESVSRCKERRNIMKEAVSLRNAFASAHSGYKISLKETGAALRDYARGEVPPPPPEEAVPSDLPASERPPPPPPPPPVESSLPPPPPPLPVFSPMPPLRRAETMPASLSHSGNGKGKMKGIADDESDIDEEEEEMEEEKGGLQRRKKGEAPLRTTPNQTTPPEVKQMAWDFFYMDEIHETSLDGVEEEEEDVEGGYGENINGNLDEKFSNVGEEIDFKTPEKQVKFEGIEEFKTPDETPAVVTTEKHFLHSNTAPPAMGRLEVNAQNAVGNKSGVDLLKLLADIDDHFLEASGSAQEVSKMLEATKLHYHSNFADNRGHINHAERVMQVITWNKSFRGTSNSETKDNADMDEYETHATILDKLLAWEKKLYEEVKAGELMKIEYQRKVAVLNKLKKRNATPEQLEKVKAAVSHLHTRYIVDMQSLDSTVTEVNDIRDKQLYPKLVSLVHGMTNMWESMCIHHESQLKIVTDLKSLDVSGFLIETSKEHHECTKQLATVIENWHSNFEKLVANQRQYIGALHSWLKLNLVPIESNWKEKVSSPPRNTNPPIKPLLAEWHDYLEKLPDDVAKGAISSFAAVIKTIILYQEEEMKLKDKYEETRREYMRKKHAFEEWYQKYAHRRTPTDESDPDKVVDPNTKDPVADKQFTVEMLRKRLEEEIDDYKKHSVQVREKSVGNLKLRLPELFRALSDYSNACFNAYKSLSVLTQRQQQQSDRGA